LQLLSAVTTSVLKHYIQKLGLDDYCVIPQFLSTQEVSHLQLIFKNKIEQNLFRPAGIGKTNVQLQRLIRSDHIFWIDEQEFPEYFKRMDQIRLLVNESLLLGAETLEAHMAVYPVDSFYQRHRDTFAEDDSRVLSTVFYLNDNWLKEDGGTLKLYLKDKEVEILPEAGTLICFFSQIVEHEVLPTQRERHSIAGWFKKRPI